jgi:hypothetical protein
MVGPSWWGSGSGPPDGAWIHAERWKPGVTLELLHLERGDHGQVRVSPVLQPPGNRGAGCGERLVVSRRLALLGRRPRASLHANSQRGYED